jgi:hypothetical protein
MIYSHVCLATGLCNLTKRSLSPNTKATGGNFGRKSSRTRHQQRETRERLNVGKTQPSVPRTDNVSQNTISRLVV